MTSEECIDVIIQSPDFINLLVIWRLVADNWPLQCHRNPDIRTRMGFVHPGRRFCATGSLAAVADGAAVQRRMIPAATILRSVAISIASLALSACSLLTIESPATPLPERDLNARMLTREFALVFGNTISREADRLIEESDDDTLRVAALRWKIYASADCLIAATQISPLVSMLDTWALTVQMENFILSERTKAFLGDQHQSVAQVASSLQAQMRQIVMSLSSSQEFARFEQIVNAHAAQYPIVSLDVDRTALISGQHWNPDDELFVLQTVGTAPEAMSDIADRMRLYGVMLPETSRWQAQLMLLESGLSSDDAVEALARLDAHMASFAELADASPEMLDAAMRDFQATAHQATGDLEKTSLAVMQAFALEREAILRELKSQQELLYKGIDEQRAAMTVDIERISNKLVADTWTNVHLLVRESMLRVIVFFVLMITLPFLAGVYIGKSRRQTAS